MQFITAFITAFLALTVIAAPQAPASPPDAATINALVPAYGVTAGQSPDGTGNCVTPIAPKPIPCSCPADRGAYLGKLDFAVKNGSTLGLPAPFPTGPDKASEKIRLQTMLSVMQNFNGSVGVGCPAISTTFKKNLDALG